MTIRPEMMLHSVARSCRMTKPNAEPSEEKQLSFHNNSPEAINDLM